MRVRLAIALFPVIFIGTPIYAESLCLQCLNAAREELKKCLEGAISQEDKISCEEKQEIRAKACEDGQCKIERVQIVNKPEGPSEKKYHFYEGMRTGFGLYGFLRHASRPLRPSRLLFTRLIHSPSPHRQRERIYKHVCEYEPGFSPTCLTVRSF